MIKWPMRSWLYVPGDSERKLVKAAQVPADVCIADLEDGVAPNRKVSARRIVARMLRELDWGGARRFVRIDSSGDWRADVVAAIEGQADGIVIPKAASPDSVAKIVMQARLQDPDLEVAPILTEAASGVLRMEETLRGIESPVAAFFGVEDLSASLGLKSIVDPDGVLNPILQTARSLFRLATSAQEVPAIDTPYVLIDDLEGLRVSAERAARHGFVGMQAIHPAHVPVINDVFVPTKAETERAAGLLAKFEEAGGGGVLRVDGQMVDRPHLEMAKKLLELSRLYGVR